MIEIWRDVLGLEGKYQVSSLGRVKTFVRWKEGRIMKLSNHPKGYLIVRLMSTNYLVHRLVAQAFVENVENKPYINHKSGNKTDNRAENLEWCTQKENLDHARKMGLIDDKGEKSNFSKLTENEVYVIKGLLKYTSLRPFQIARIFGVINETIYAIRDEKSWKYIKLEEK